LKLEIVEGVPEDKGKQLELPPSGVVRVGRGRDTETQLRDLSVSRQHCRLEVNRGQIRLVDVPTDDPRRPKPTFVNDRPVSEVVLRPGDRIRIGSTVLRLRGDKEVADEETMRPEDVKNLNILLPPIPPPPAPPQGLPVSCQCGAQLRYRPICEGTWVRCPMCGDFLQLPGKANLGESVMMSSYRIQRRPPRHGPVVPTSATAEILKVVGTVLATLFVLSVLVGVAYFVASQASGPPATETETETPAAKEGKDGKETKPAKDAKEGKAPPPARDGKDTPAPKTP
jgi:hypothetical protein